MNNREARSTSSLYISARKEMDEKFGSSKMCHQMMPADSEEMLSLYEGTDKPRRIYISSSCKEIMGYDPEEMIGLSAYDFILPEDVKQLKESIHPTFNGKPSITQYRAIKKDGTLIWLESNSNPIYNDHGKMIGFQTSARDITHQKLFEQELILAKEKTERTSARLKELLDENNDLIGLLSHDMRSPINQIKGLVKLMATSIDNKDLLRLYLEKIDQAVHHQNELLQHILSMLKSEQMSSDAERLETLPLLSLINTVRQNLECDLKCKNQRLLVEIPKSLEVKVQPGLFVQALHNLISNSIKFSYPGTEISLRAKPEPDVTIITILDHGIGFEPKKANRLFDRFTREGRKGTNDEPSTGLGLYLVKKIIHQHEGAIEACSDGEGKGALFTIRLPLNTAYSGTKML